MTKRILTAVALMCSTVAWAGSSSQSGSAETGSPSDEKSFIWKQYKPGFEVNQHGHIRTTNHQPPAG